MAVKVKSYTRNMGGKQVKVKAHKRSPRGFVDSREGYKPPRDRWEIVVKDGNTWKRYGRKTYGRNEALRTAERMNTELQKNRYYYRQIGKESAVYGADYRNRDYYTKHSKRMARKG